jgi:succinyl-CoA synthetase beta subunit
MNLTEFEGKELLRSYGVTTPCGERIEPGQYTTAVSFPLVLKSQVPTSDRKAKGGIKIIESLDTFAAGVDALFATAIDGMLPKYLLAEEFIKAEAEIYVSFSYASDFRSPALSLNQTGGSGIQQATVIPINLLEPFDEEIVRAALVQAHVGESTALVTCLIQLWELFQKEKVLLTEVNPLFLLSDGRVVAGDAKIVRDEALEAAQEKPIIPLGGDIAIIASGGGASMLNIDILMRVGGKPANYVEYSGNPPAALVEELTTRVLSAPGIRGVWVVGGTANFTDLFETLSGFVAGLRKMHPKPTYPIVIRRDGPRRAEAKEMLEKVAKEEGFNLFVFGPEISMARSAEILLQEIQNT